MPIRPPRQCPAPNCAAKTSNGLCPEHAAARQRDVDARRGTAASRGYTYRWRKEAKAFLASHPLCVHCTEEGRVGAAECVDHRIPHRGDQVLFWDHDNWQGLCNSHHAIKTAAEDGGFGHTKDPP